MLNSTKLNRIGLNRVAVNRLINITAPSVQTYTVDDLIQLGYLTAYGNENEGYRIDTAQPLPMPIRDIKDFDAVFIGRSVPANVDTQRACMFNLSDKSHLTESQQQEIISKYNNKPNDRAISQLLFRNYTLPNADLKIIQNKTSEDSWQYSHKMFEGSTFNNVELNIKGSISSTNKLFMGITCNELEIYANSSSGNNMVAGTDVIAPHDTTEMFASAAINKYPRGVSYYRGLANWTFTNNWDGKATEIPNVRGVETEEERITSSINVMKLPSGILYQTLWISSITRIGPVLDVTNVTGSEYLWGNCGIQLPNVTDIRIKGLNNLDWDFRGGATDKAFIPKMDEDSIIYCLNNVVEQTDTTRNIYFSTEVIKPTYEENSAEVKTALFNASTKGWNVYCGDTVLIIPDTPPVGNYIQFEDPAVEAICVANWSSDGIGLTEEDAAKVTSIGDIFVGNTAITSFDEFQYFTGIEVVGSFGWGSAHGFSGCTSLRSIVLPKSAKSLCNGCFKNTTSLTSLKGTENITTLGHSSYGNDTFMNSAITDVDFSNLQEIIGNDAFLGSGIKVVNFPKLKKLGMGAFKNSKVERVISLGEVTSLDGTTDYMRGMFYGCTFLESVALPKTLHTIGVLCFRNCSALKNCNIPDSVTTIENGAFYGAPLDGMDIVLKNVQRLQSSTFKQSKIRSIIMPNVITTAGTIDFAAGNFYQCTSLEYALFGKTLSSIGGGEFNNCSEMRAFVCLANVPPTMAAQCFNNTLIASGSGYIYVPDASLEAHKTATNWNAYANKIKGISDLATDNPTIYEEVQQYL